LITINKKSLYQSMLKIIWVILSLILIGLIFLRTPQNQGLASFSTKSNLLGSPSSAEQFLNNLTIFLMVSYFLFAIFLNVSN
jgi:protein translocase SecG subunit